MQKIKKILRKVLTILKSRYIIVIRNVIISRGGGFMSKKIRRYYELSALKGLIREKGLSYRKISDSISIGVNTLCDKINGYYIMTADDIENICKELDIIPQDIPKYFFPNMLRNATKTA